MFTILHEIVLTYGWWSEAMDGSCGCQQLRQTRVGHRWTNDSYHWLVVYLPLWKIWVRQLAYIIPNIWKNRSHVPVTTNQRVNPIKTPLNHHFPMVSERGPSCVSSNELAGSFGCSRPPEMSHPMLLGPVISSGNLLHSCGTSPILMGKSAINGHFPWLY